MRFVESHVGAFYSCSTEEEGGALALVLNKSNCVAWIKKRGNRLRPPLAANSSPSESIPSRTHEASQRAGPRRGQEATRAFRLNRLKHFVSNEGPVKSRVECIVRRVLTCPQRR